MTDPQVSGPSWYQHDDSGCRGSRRYLPAEWRRYRSPSSKTAEIFFLLFFVKAFCNHQNARELSTSREEARHEKLNLDLGDNKRPAHCILSQNQILFKKSEAELNQNPDLIGTCNNTK